MDKNFSELIEYLDKKFSGVDERLISLDDKSEELKENKADKSDINELINAIDAYAKKADAYFQDPVKVIS